MSLYIIRKCGKSKVHTSARDFEKCCKRWNLKLSRHFFIAIYVLKKGMNQKQHFLRDREADALRLKDREQSRDRMPALIGKSRSVFRKSKSAKNLIDRA